MYKAAHNKDGSLKHSNECKMAFGKKDDQCPRCAEMIAGSPARSGWQTAHFKTKKRLEEKQIQDIKAHFSPNGPHATGKCGPVCTYGDY